MHSCRSPKCKRGCLTAGPNAGVPVFYFDQDQKGVPCARLSREEVRQLKLVGDGRFVHHGKAFQLYRRGPEPERRYTPSKSGDSDRSISLAEMQANVGITANQTGADWRESAPALRHVVQRAQQKIRAIGRREEGTYDEKSPLPFLGDEALRNAATDQTSPSATLASPQTPVASPA